jgi:hypothetical protein
MALALLFRNFLQMSGSGYISGWIGTTPKEVGSTQRQVKALSR